MTTLTTNNQRIMIVEVPEDAKDFKVINISGIHNLEFSLPLPSMENNLIGLETPKEVFIDLIATKYTILGTITSVQSIRQLRSEGMFLKDIAAKFSLSHSHVSDIANNKYWNK